MVKKESMDLWPTSLEGLVESSEGIKLIYESKKQGYFIEAHKLLRNAERVYFMGFGYDETNLNNLNIIENFLDKKEGNKTYSRSASGTGFLLPQSIKNRISLYHKRIRIDIESIDCLKFLNRNGL